MMFLVFVYDVFSSLFVLSLCYDYEWCKQCCLGMGADSKEFAGELYDALARRRNISVESGINLSQVKVFWEDMTSKDLESRLQVFFDM